MKTISKHLKLMVITLMLLLNIVFVLKKNTLAAEVTQEIYPQNEISGYLDDNIYASNKYSFSIPKSGRVTLTMTVLDFHDCSLTITNSSNEKLWSVYAREGEKTHSIDLLSGQYYIVVGHDNGGGNYKLRYDFKDANETFSDNGENLMYTSPEINIGTNVYNGQLASDDKKDLFCFNINNLSKVCVGFSVYNFHDCGVSILNEGGDVIWRDYIGEGNKNSIIELKPGKYYLCVSVDNGTGNYSFFIDYFSEKYCNHNYKDSVILPTFIKRGYKLHKCTECGKSFKDEYTGKKSLGQVLSPNAIAKKKGIIISFLSVSEADGYQIRYSTDKKFKKKVTYIKTKSTQKTIKKLKNKRKYYVQIRAYKKSQGQMVYGKWSPKKTAKTK